MSSPSANLHPDSANDPSPSQQSYLSKFANLPFGLQWRTAALRAQRLVPSQVTYLTSPLGPHPITTELPSRGPHKIPVWIFIPSFKRELRDAKQELRKEKKDAKCLKRQERKDAKDLKRLEKKEAKAKKGPTTRPDLVTAASTLSIDSTVSTAPSTASTSSSVTRVDKKTVRSLPIHLDFHGGGFTTGSCTEQAPFCAMLARETNRVVITVDYRLGPLDQYPAAVHDAEDVLRAILDQALPECDINALPKQQKIAAVFLRKELLKEKVRIDPSQLSIGGFSSGGNLALGLAVPQSLLTERLPKTQKVPLLLFYPSLDARLLPHERPKPPGMLERTESNNSVLKLTTTLMTGITESYLPQGSQRGEMKASPGLADPDSVFQGAQILLVNAEWDTLALQGREWTEKMRAKGWTEDRLEIWESAGMKHGWTQFPESWLVEGEVVERDRVFQRALEILRKRDVVSTDNTANKPDADEALAP